MLLHLDLVPEAPLVVEAFNAAVVVAEVRLRGLAYQQAELQPNPHAFGGMVFDQQDAPGEPAQASPPSRVTRSAVVALSWIFKIANRIAIDHFRLERVDTLLLRPPPERPPAAAAEFGGSPSHC